MTISKITSQYEQRIPDSTSNPQAENPQVQLQIEEDLILEELLKPVILESDSFFIPNDIQAYIDECTRNIADFELTRPNDNIITELHTLIPSFISKVNVNLESKFPSPQIFSPLLAKPILGRITSKINTAHQSTLILNQYRSMGPVGSSTLGRHQTRPQITRTPATNHPKTFLVTCKGSQIPITAISTSNRK